MNENETTTALVRAYDRAYINGKFVTPHGTQVVDLVNPTNNSVIGKVTMADEIDTRQAIAAAKEAFNTFSQSSEEFRVDANHRGGNYDLSLIHSGRLHSTRLKGDQVRIVGSPPARMGR